MPENYRWLAISIFYNQQSILTLLQAIAQGHANDYLIELNDQHGQNMRFAVQTPERGAIDEAKNMGEYFTARLATQNCFPMEDIIPPEAIFKAFPQNSIAFGLYTPFATGHAEIDHHTRFVFSKLLTELFITEEGIDPQTVLSIATYLFVALILIALRTGYAGKDVLSTLFLRTLHTIQKRIQIDETLLDQEDCITIAEHVKGHIFNRGLVDESLPWLTRWIDLCHPLLTTESGAPKIDPKMELFFRLSLLIKKQLGLSLKIEFIITRSLLPIIQSYP